jgi:hypothetical protein
MTRSNTDVAAWPKTAVAIASGVLAVGAGVGVASVAYADTIAPAPNPTSAPSEIPSPETQPPVAPGNPYQAPVEPGNPDYGSSEDALIEELSRVLGIDTETLKAMLEEVRATYGEEWSAVVNEQLDAAVAAGLLTQAEADAVRQALNDSATTVGG